MKTYQHSPLVHQCVCRASDFFQESVQRLVMPAAIKLRTAHEGHPRGELDQHVVFRLVWDPQIGEACKVRLSVPVEVLTCRRSSSLRVRSNNPQQFQQISPRSLDKRTFVAERWHMFGQERHHILQKGICFPRLQSELRTRQ